MAASLVALDGRSAVCPASLSCLQPACAGEQRGLTVLSQQGVVGWGVVRGC